MTQVLKHPKKCADSSPLLKYIEEMIKATVRYILCQRSMKFGIEKLTKLTHTTLRINRGVKLLYVSREAY